jgi:hypothetical protein
VILLVVLGAWFATGVLATLVLGPRLRRAAEQAGVALEQEPVYIADRSPLRWRLGTLGVVGLLAGSTGMAAAGALPGSAQTIAHHVLGTVGVHVPEAPDAPTEVATGPAQTPWSDVTPSTSSPGSGTADPPSGPPPPAPPADDGGPDDTAAGSDVTATEPAASGSGGSTATTPPPVVRPEGSDVPDEAPPADEPSDVPDDPPAEETPPTTTPPGEEQPPPDPTTTTTTSTTSTTSTTLPPAEPSG